MTSSPNFRNTEEYLQTQNPNMTDDDDKKPEPIGSSKIETLKTPDLENSQQLDLDHLSDQQEEEANAQDQKQEEHEGMSVSIPSSPHPLGTISIPDHVPENPPSSVSRRNAKRKKQIPHQTRVAIEKKLDVLNQNLNPISFVPPKTLDIAAHEKILKRLGLWEFVHVEFDRNIRADLLAQLIASYNSKKGYSFVNGVRVNVKKPTLARALNLPVKKDKDSINLMEANGDESEVLSEESIKFISDFVTNWFLLHEEDMWMMPDEVMNRIRFIKDGHPEKVDWAGLMWFMVDKELVQGTQLVDCYYASHFQCLIKSQRGDLFTEESKVEINIKDDDEEEKGDDVKMVEPHVVDDVKMVEPHAVDDVKMVDSHVIREEPEVEAPAHEPEVEAPAHEPEVEVHAQKPEVQVHGHEVGGDFLKVKMGESDNVEIESYEFQGHEMGETNIASSSGQENFEKEPDNVEKEPDNVEKEGATEEDIMELEDCNEEEEEEEEEGEDGQWHLDRRNDVDRQFLRRCNLEEDTGLDFYQNREVEEVDDEDDDDEEVQEEQDGGFRHLPEYNNSLDGMAMEAVQHNPFSSNVRFSDHSSMDHHFSLRAESNLIPGEPSMFGNAGKRAIDDEHNMSHHSPNGNYKRQRIDDGLWNQKPEQDEVVACMEQIQSWMGKLHMVYQAKQHSSAESSMNQQALLSELEQRNNMIDHLTHLTKTNYEESQKKKVEIHRLERELYLMQNIVEGYRKALKETTRTFAEYRSRCPLPDEPLYKDVPGSGGLVLSTMELEKRRLKQEEEDRMMRIQFVRMFEEFELGWTNVFEKNLGDVHLLDSKLLTLEKQVKDLSANRKVSKTIGCSPDE